MERVDGKAAGDYGFITCQKVGLADGARADAILHAAKLDGVIHRGVSDPYLEFGCEAHFVLLTQDLCMIGSESVSCS
jgi:hypothetical protein